MTMAAANNGSSGVRRLPQASAPSPFMPQPQRNWTHMTRTIAHYERIEQIGEGTYGQVYRARCKDTNQIVALKKIRVHYGGYWGIPPTVMREIKILKRLRHPNLVQMVEVVSSKGVEHLDEDDEVEEKHKLNKKDRIVDAREGFKGNLFLVLEYVSHDLTGLMDVAYRFSEVQVKCIFRQLLEALQYMHENKFIHRDIKSSNILIDHNFRVKLADFGLARSVEPPILDKIHDRLNSQEFTNKVITLWYRPPEILLGATKYGPPVDVWSAGCILAELMLGKPLFTGKTEMDQLQLIFELLGTPTPESWEGFQDLKLLRTGEVTIETARKAKLREKYQAKMSVAALNLLEKLLELDPMKRLTAERALHSRFFLSDPRAPERPEELGPLLLEGGHFHEFQTKKKRREAKVIAEKARQTALDAGLSEKQAAAEYDSVYREVMEKVAKEGINSSTKLDDKNEERKPREKHDDDAQRRERKRERSSRSEREGKGDRSDRKGDRDDRKEERRRDDREREHRSSRRRRESEDHGERGSTRRHERSSDEDRRKKRRRGSDHSKPNDDEGNRDVANGLDAAEKSQESEKTDKTEQMQEVENEVQPQNSGVAANGSSETRKDREADVAGPSVEVKSDLSAPHTSDRKITEKEERRSSKRRRDRSRSRSRSHERDRERDRDRKSSGDRDRRSSRDPHRRKSRERDRDRDKDRDRDARRRRSVEKDRDRERKRDRREREDEDWDWRGRDKDGDRDPDWSKGSRAERDREPDRGRGDRDRNSGGDFRWPPSRNAPPRGVEFEHEHYGPRGPFGPPRSGGLVPPDFRGGPTPEARGGLPPPNLGYGPAGGEYRGKPPGGQGAPREQRRREHQDNEWGRDRSPRRDRGRERR